jgi:hypothetical protein
MKFFFNCNASITDGASIITSLPELFFRECNKVTMFLDHPKYIDQSKANPPCGGAPN